MSVIEIENLVKKYGDNAAVDNLNLKIEKGKVYGFLGPNGRFIMIRYRYIWSLKKELFFESKGLVNFQFVKLKKRK